MYTLTGGRRWRGGGRAAQALDLAVVVGVGPGVVGLHLDVEVVVAGLDREAVHDVVVDVLVLEDGRAQGAQVQGEGVPIPQVEVLALHLDLGVGRHRELAGTSEISKEKRCTFKNWIWHCVRLDVVFLRSPGSIPQFSLPVDQFDGVLIAGENVSAAAAIHLVCGTI